VRVGVGAGLAGVLVAVRVGVGAGLAGVLVANSSTATGCSASRSATCSWTT
jgi:hypothetical protein